MADDDTDDNPKPFATGQDLADRWHPLDEMERIKASVLIADASELIRATCPNWDKATQATLRMVTCMMVRRAMLAGDDIAGVSQTSQTAGSFSESFTYSNPMGDLYLTAQEKRMLGMGRQHAYHITLESHEDDLPEVMPL